jgi:quinolinate synthase
MPRVDEVARGIIIEPIADPGPGNSARNKRMATPLNPVAEAADILGERLRNLYPPVEWAALAGEISVIRELKRRRRAVVLAHNYMTPDIYFGIADVTGDSLALARAAQKIDAQVVVMAGVYFMAETVKILNPERTVLIPDREAGCSLAESITAEDVRALRDRHPGVPVVTYVNTSAEVKAESDVCCTSSNARRVVESLGVPRVILIPDRYLAANVARETEVEIVLWPGRCVVHERFRAEEIREIRAGHPGVRVLAHPECPPDVVAEADFSGSTTALSDYVAREHPQTVVLLTECSMSDNVAAEHPDVRFVRPCNLCPYMKMNSLVSIRRALETLSPAVEVPAEVAARARRAIERMLAL